MSLLELWREREARRLARVAVVRERTDARLRFGLACCSSERFGAFRLGVAWAVGGYAGLSGAEALLTPNGRIGLSDADARVAYMTNESLVLLAALCAAVATFLLFLFGEGVVLARVRRVYIRRDYRLVNKSSSPAFVERCEVCCGWWWRKAPVVRKIDVKPNPVESHDGRVIGIDRSAIAAALTDHFIETGRVFPMRPFAGSTVWVVVTLGTGKRVPRRIRQRHAQWAMAVEKLHRRWDARRTTSWRSVVQVGCKATYLDSGWMVWSGVVVTVDGKRACIRWDAAPSAPLSTSKRVPDFSPPPDIDLHKIASDAKSGFGYEARGGTTSMIEDAVRILQHPAIPEVFMPRPSNAFVASELRKPAPEKRA